MDKGEMQVYEIRVCFRVAGTVKDRHGNPASAGVCIKLGESSEEIPYTTLVNNVNKHTLLKLAHLDTAGKTVEDIIFITPEQYDREFPDE